jgi:hypothetical protein
LDVTGPVSPAATLGTPMTSAPIRREVGIIWASTPTGSHRRLTAQNMVRNENFMTKGAASRVKDLTTIL